MEVNEHDEFVVAGLEEEMFDVGKEHLNPLVTHRHIADTVLMDLDVSGQTLPIKRRAREHIGKLIRTSA